MTQVSIVKELEERAGIGRTTAKNRIREVKKQMGVIGADYSDEIRQQIIHYAVTGDPVPVQGEIQLEAISSNPYRDMKLDPIRDEMVAEMAASIDTLGFWGGLAVRKHGEGYQLAFGHHRLAALRSLGWSGADISIVEYDDDQMIAAMVKENATQRGTEGGGNIDAVAAIIRRIGYLLLTDGVINLSHLDASALTQARNNFMQGKGVGRRIISEYEPSLTYQNIQNALSALNAAGYMQTIAEMVLDQIKAEGKDDHAASVAVANASAECFYDTAVEGIFRRESHASAFRAVVTSKDGKKYLPANQHAAMAQQIVKEAQEDNAVKSVNANYITSSVTKVLHQAMTYRDIQQDKLDSQIADEAANSGWKGLVSGANKAAHSVAKLLDAMDRGGRVPTLRNAQAYMRIDIAALQDDLQTLTDRLNETDDVVSNQ